MKVQNPLQMERITDWDNNKKNRYMCQCVLLWLVFWMLVWLKSNAGNVTWFQLGWKAKHGSCYYRHAHVYVCLNLCHTHAGMCMPSCFCVLIMFRRLCAYMRFCVHVWFGTLTWFVISSPAGSLYTAVRRWGDKRGLRHTFLFQTSRRLVTGLQGARGW